jgi:hypothetical protein
VIKVGTLVSAITQAAVQVTPSDPNYRRFVTGLAAFVAVPPFLLAALVVTVDPYYVFGSPDLPGINAVRPLYEPHIPVAKPYQIRRINPDAVILGSSRAEVGLDPQHPGWAGRLVFNFGLPSATSYEVTLAFLHAQAGQSLKQAVVGLDFFAYNIFFPRSHEYIEARFSGDGVEAFADFLASELANRRQGRDTTARPRIDQVKPSPEPAEEDSASPADWNEALYLRIYPDVAAEVRKGTFASGYQHYLAAGRAEGRGNGTPPPGWNEALYLRLYPDVAAEVHKGTFLSGYHHYLLAGRTEGRNTATPPSGWNEALYLRLYPDVAAEVRKGTFLSGYHHYLLAGRTEGRNTGTPPPGWNEATYLSINPDVRSEVARGTFISGYHHYLAAGKSERRQGGFIPRDWNDLGYRQVNQDVDNQIAQGRIMNGNQHSPAAGRAEGRTGDFLPDDWNEARYLENNPAARIRLALGEYGDGYGHYAAGRTEGALGDVPAKDILNELRQRWPRLRKAVFQVSELFRLVLSKTAVNDALATLRRQSDPASFNDRGMRVWNSQEDVLRAMGGTGLIFRGTLAGSQWHLWLMPPRYMYCFNNPDTAMSSFDAFRFMLRRGYERDTDLRLFMTPLHVSVRHLLVELGLGDRYEFWQRELVRINEEEAVRAGRKSFPLWDFSDGNSITREAIPDATELTPMHWFWEISHYRSATGTLILDRVLEHSSAERTLPADFGVRLTGDTIDAHLAHSKAELANWAMNSEFAMQISTATRGPTVQNRQAEATCW